MTGPTILLDVDGTPVPASDCDWIMFAPCGCPCAVTVVDRRGGEGYLLTEDQVFIALSSTNTKTEAARDKAAGYTVKLVTHQAWSEHWFPKFKDKCPHDPTWGVEKTPVPDGYVWAAVRWPRQTPYRHLVPTAAIDDYKADQAPLCKQGGRSRQSSWRVDEWVKSETMECSRCAAQAHRVAEDGAA